jgi:SlyX protein
VVGRYKHRWPAEARRIDPRHGGKWRGRSDVMEGSTATALQALGARIDNLEMRLTYQDEVIEGLNKVIIEQWNKLDQAAWRIGRLEAQLREAQTNAGSDGHDEPPPPHY